MGHLLTHVLNHVDLGTRLLGEGLLKESGLWMLRENAERECREGMRSENAEREEMLTFNVVGTCTGSRRYLGM